MLCSTSLDNSSCSSRNLVDAHRRQLGELIAELQQLTDESEQIRARLDQLTATNRARPLNVEEAEEALRLSQQAQSLRRRNEQLRVEYQQLLAKQQQSKAS
jgi:uncharacterized coiled-coil DUF342 family protein